MIEMPMEADNFGVGWQKEMIRIIHGGNDAYLKLPTPRTTVRYRIWQISQIFQRVRRFLGEN